MRSGCQQVTDRDIKVVKEDVIGEDRNWEVPEAVKKHKGYP